MTRQLSKNPSLTRAYAVSNGPGTLLDYGVLDVRDGRSVKETLEPYGVAMSLVDSGAVAVVSGDPEYAETGK